jgi:hypothetical protein
MNNSSSIQKILYIRIYNFQIFFIYISLCAIYFLTSMALSRKISSITYKFQSNSQGHKEYSANFIVESVNNPQSFS